MVVAPGKSIPSLRWLSWRRSASSRARAALVSSKRRGGVAVRAGAVCRSSVARPSPVQAEGVGLSPSGLGTGSSSSSGLSGSRRGAGTRCGVARSWSATARGVGCRPVASRGALGSVASGCSVGPTGVDVGVDERESTTATLSSGSCRAAVACPVPARRGIEGRGVMVATSPRVRPRVRPRARTRFMGCPRNKSHALRTQRDLRDFCDRDGALEVPPEAERARSGGPEAALSSSRVARREGSRVGTATTSRRAGGREGGPGRRGSQRSRRTTPASPAATKRVSPTRSTAVGAASSPSTSSVRNTWGAAGDDTSTSTTRGDGEEPTT